MPSRAAAPTLRRRLALATAFSALGLLGALPGGAGRATAESLLAWLALACVPLGLLAGRFGLGGLLALVVLPWLVVLQQLAHSSAAVRAPLLGWAAVTGLFACAAGFGARLSGPPWRATGLAACAVGLLAALPTGGGVLATPWPPAVTARLLDVSTLAFVEECAGVDWLLLGDNYTQLGSDSIDPALRSAWNGGRSAPLLLVLGALSVGIARLLERRDQRRAAAGLR